MAFKIKEEFYESKVMPFGLSNAPNTFQRLINNVLRHFIEDFVLVYFDDILIYSKSRNDHILHLQKVCEVLKAQQLYVHLKTHSFLVEHIFFLGFILSSHDISMDPTKKDVIIKWPTPRNFHDILSFYRLATFYGRFILNFTTIMAPMMIV